MLSECESRQQEVQDKIIEHNQVSDFLKALTRGILQGQISCLPKEVQSKPMKAALVNLENAILNQQSDVKNRSSEMHHQVCDCINFWGINSDVCRFVSLLQLTRVCIYIEAIIECLSLIIMNQVFVIEINYSIFCHLNTFLYQIKDLHEKNENLQIENVQLNDEIKSFKEKLDSQESSERMRSHELKLLREQSKTTHEQVRILTLCCNSKSLSLIKISQFFIILGILVMFLKCILIKIVYVHCLPFKNLQTIKEYDDIANEMRSHLESFEEKQASMRKELERKDQQVKHIFCF